MRLNNVVSRFVSTGVFVLTATLACGQSLQHSGLTYIKTIPVPNWKVGTANVDVFGFNPLTRIMYLADRTNHGIDLIDTHDNSFLGILPLAMDTVPNVPLVPIDQQQLAISDGLSSVYVYDLRAPAAQPDHYIMPSTTTDGMDYDPINRTLYVVTDDKPYYLVGISLTQKKIVSQTALPGNPDLIKFNPTDGNIYITIEDADNMSKNPTLVAFDPVANALVTTYPTPNCPGHGIDIDPISNIAVVGCFGGTSNGNLAIDLTTGKTLKYFPDVGGTDTVVFDPANRRFYAAAGLNTAATSGCPGTLPGPFGTTVPILGVIDAKGKTAESARLDGVVCTGRGNHTAGVDPITNSIYVPASQFPADPASNTTGQAGILVFHDGTRLAQPLVSIPSRNLTESAKIPPQSQCAPL
jgi:hypothetical protein